MTTEMIEAVYEHGGFRPIVPVDMNLTEGQKVRRVVDDCEEDYLFPPDLFAPITLPEDPVDALALGI